MSVGRDTQQDSPNSRIRDHSKCLRIYTQQQIVSDPFHLRHSSEKVLRSRFPWSLRVHELVLISASTYCPALEGLTKHLRPNPVRDDIGNNVGLSPTAG